MHMTWEQTNKLNTIIATRPMMCSNYLNMQWYKIYIHLVSVKVMTA